MKLTRAHYDLKMSLKKHAFLKVHNLVVSDDLVQDTFTKTWIYMVKGGKIENMKAFLFHILNNLIIDEYRKHKTISLDSLLEKGFELGVDNFPRVVDQLDGKMIQFLIDCLPEKYRKVMKMRYIQDLSIAEISLLTGQSKNTIAVQTHRGLTRLKKLCHN